MSLERALAFRNLSVILDAGLPLSGALASAAEGGELGPAFLRLRLAIEGGASLEEAVKVDAAFDELERALITVGETTGDLPKMMLVLAERHEQALALRRELVGVSIYPLMILHVAVIVSGLPAFASGALSFGAWLATMLVPIGLFWGLVLSLSTWIRRGEARRVAAFVERVPLFAKAQSDLQRHHYFAALQAMHSAGLGLDTTLARAQALITARGVRRELAGCLAAARAGRPASMGLGAHFPADLASIWKSGELSGTLDRSFELIARLSREQSIASFATAVSATGWILFGLAVVVVVLQVVPW